MLFGHTDLQNSVTQGKKGLASLKLAKWFSWLILRRMFDIKKENKKFRYKKENKEI